MPDLVILPAHDPTAARRLLKSCTWTQPWVSGPLALVAPLVTSRVKHAVAANLDINVVQPPLSQRSATVPPS
jgi:hypothetical protein